MRSITARVRLGLALSGPRRSECRALAAQRPAPMQAGVLRVCADPDNLPALQLSRRGAGEQAGRADGQRPGTRKLEYVWWAAPRGMMRMLNGMLLRRDCCRCRCSPTWPASPGPYFRTSYVMVQRKDAAHRVTGLDDPALKTMKIGVHLFAADGENTPPAMALVVPWRRGQPGGLQHHLHRRDEPPRGHHQGRGRPTDRCRHRLGADRRVLRQAARRRPAAHAGRERLADRDPLRLQHGDGHPPAGAPAFRDSLQKFLDSKAPEIRTILEQYGIPLLPLAAGLRRARRAGGRPGTVAALHRSPARPGVRPSLTLGKGTAHSDEDRG